MTDHNRLYEFVARIYKESGEINFPTVKEAAQALDWTLKRVENAIEGDPHTRMSLVGYHLEETLDDQFIAIEQPERGT